MRPPVPAGVRVGHAVRMPPLLHEAALDALALLLPVECAGCGRPDRALCSACRAQLEDAPSGHTLAVGIRVLSALRYEGAVRLAILAFKEQGRTDLARALSRPLGLALAEAARAIAPTSGERVELCTVPPSREAWRRRGYSPVDLLLRSAGFRAAHVLAQTGLHEDQKVLGRAARRKNLEGSLVSRRSLSGRHFIVVDDILTTGSTIEEAVRAVREAGGTVACGATLAFTPRLFEAIGGS